MGWSGTAPNKTYSRTDGSRSGSTTWQQAESAGVDIVSDDHDTHDQDLATSINTSLQTDGKNKMTAGLPAADGSSGLPGYAFAADTNTGFYRISSGVVGYASDGVKTAEFDGAGIVPRGSLSKTGAYTVLTTDRGKTIYCDASGGAFTITLPPAASATDGFEVTIVKTDTSFNAVTVDGDGSETINGAATFTLTSPYAAERVQCTGSAWHRLWNPPSPGFMATKSGNQGSITAGAETKLTFDTELWDQNGVYDTSTSRATPPAGRYIVTAAAHVGANSVEADRRLAIIIKKNGSAYRQNYETVSTTENQNVSIDALIEANGTDYFEVFVNLEGTTAKTVAAGESLTWFGMTKI